MKERAKRSHSDEEGYVKNIQCRMAQQSLLSHKLTF